MLENTIHNFQRKLLVERNFHYACIICGLLCPSFFFGGFIAAGFIPPLKPSLSADDTANHYHKHTTGARVGACLILFSGMFYLPWTAVITTQMNRIPRLPRGLNMLQLASGAASVFTFILPAMVLALIAYRPERPAQLTQILNDMFWIFAVMPWPSFLAQNWAFAYAIFVDTRPKPLFPKYMAAINTIAPLLFSPALGIHFVKSGVVAWNGALAFWLAAVGFGLQFGVDAYCIYFAVKSEDIDEESLPTVVHMSTDKTDCSSS